jgi:hypothetical protein
MCRGGSDPGLTLRCSQMSGELEQDRLADQRAVGAELVAPQRIAQHHHRRFALLLFLRDRPPQRHAASQELEQAGGAPRRHHRLRFAVLGQADRLQRHRADGGKHPCLVAQIEVFAQRSRRLLDVAEIERKHHQALRLAVGQRLEQHGVDHAENGVDRSRSEPQAEQHGQRERRLLAQAAQRQTQVLPEAFQPG